MPMKKNRIAGEVSSCRVFDRSGMKVRSLGRPPYGLDACLNEVY
jgi:hypothetical protein